MSFFGNNSETIQQEALLKRKAKLAQAIFENMRGGNPNEVVSNRVIPLNPLAEGLKGLGRVYAIDQMNDVEDQQTKLAQALYEQKMKGFNNLLQNQSPEVSNNAQNMNEAGIDPSTYLKNEISSTGQMKNARASGLATPIAYEKAKALYENQGRINLENTRQGGRLQLQNNELDYRDNNREDNQSFDADQNDRNRNLRTTLQNNAENRRLDNTLVKKVVTLPNGNTVERDVTLRDQINQTKARNVSAKVTKNNQNMMNDPNSAVYIPPESELNDGVIDGKVVLSPSNRKQRQFQFEKLDKESQRVSSVYNKGLADLQRARKLLKAGINTGAWSSISQAWDKYGLGEGVKADNTEAFFAIMGQGAIDEMAKLGGNDSEQELREMKKIVAADPVQGAYAMDQYIQRKLKEFDSLKRDYAERLKAFKDGNYDPIVPKNQYESHSRPASRPARNYSEMTDEELSRALNGR